jgi:uncharacterized protein YegL
LNPTATAPFEEAISAAYFEHKDNTEERKIVTIPLVSKSHLSSIPGGEPPTGTSKHIIFVLDESGSMQNDWSGVVVAYNDYMKRRLDQQMMLDLVSVIQFDNWVRVTVSQTTIVNAPSNLDYLGGGTCFGPAAASARSLALQTPMSHAPVVVFMSDGCANDAAAAASTFATLNREIQSRFGQELELHVIGFGNGVDTTQLRAISDSSRRGSLHSVSTITGLSNVFVQIAGGTDISNVLEAEIGKRIYDAVTDRLTAEYVG